MRVTEKRVLDNILFACAHYFAVPVGDIKTKSRVIELVEPRQVAMALGYVFTVNTYKQVGFYIAERKHATVIHSIKTVISHYDTEKEYSELIDGIISLVNRLCGSSFTFDNIRDYQSKKNVPRAKVNDLFHDFDDKIEELMLAITYEQKDELLNEAKALWNSINYKRSMEAVLNLEENEIKEPQAN